MGREGGPIQTFVCSLNDNQKDKNQPTYLYTPPLSVNIDDCLGCFDRPGESRDGQYNDQQVLALQIASVDTHTHTRTFIWVAMHTVHIYSYGRAGNYTFFGAQVPTFFWVHKNMHVALFSIFCAQVVKWVRASSYIGM